MMAKAEGWRKLEHATRLKSKGGSMKALKISICQTSNDKVIFSHIVHASTWVGSSVDATKESDRDLDEQVE